MVLTSSHACNFVIWCALLVYHWSELLVRNCLVTMSLHAGHSDNDTDFITTLTGLFKDIATAVEENHDMLMSSFGASFLVDFTLGLQAECDLQVWQGTSADAHPL